jgi:hypothetical protein
VYHSSRKKHNQVFKWTKLFLQFLIGRWSTGIRTLGSDSVTIVDPSQAVHSRVTCLSSTWYNRSGFEPRTFHQPSSQEMDRQQNQWLLLATQTELNSNEQEHPFYSIHRCLMRLSMVVLLHTSQLGQTVVEPEQLDQSKRDNRLYFATDARHSGASRQRPGASWHSPY